MLNIVVIHMFIFSPVSGGIKNAKIAIDDIKTHGSILKKK